MDHSMSLKQPGLLIIFLVLVVGGGALIGVMIDTSWYGQLQRPSFAPPPWLFGPVWTILYIMIAVCGWRIWTRPFANSLRGIWLLQMALNFVWTPVFFGMQNIGLALAIIAALLVTIIVFILRALPLDRVSALLFLPYLAWVGFATALTFAIFRLN